MLKSLWIACLVGITLFWSSLSLADSKKTCPAKIVETKTIQGQLYKIEQEWPFLFISLRDTNGKTSTVQIPYTAAVYASYLGRNLTITYELLEYWNYHDNDCIQDPIIISVKDTNSDIQLIELATYIMNDDHYLRRIELTRYANFNNSLQFEYLNKKTNEYQCDYFYSEGEDNIFYRSSSGTDDDTQEKMVIADHGDTLEIIEVPKSFPKNNTHVLGTYVKKTDAIPLLHSS